MNLVANQQFDLNAIDRSEKTEDLHLSRSNGKYLLDVLGKTGEFMQDRQVNVTIKHRDFRDAVNISLQTDERGRVLLGTLRDIAHVTATGPQGTSHTWHLRQDENTQYRSLHGLAGGVINIPFVGPGEKPSRQDVSLLEMRAGTFVKERFDALTIQDGLLRVRGLPRGNYDLLLKRSGARINLRVSEGQGT